MQILMDAAAGIGLPITFTAVYIIGFLAAVIIGSIAWYNSKRPPGWENAQRPDIVPNLETDSDDKSES
ncbi:MAG: photosystem II assembly protein Psb35 [Spirulinaceae cyanobacterium]